MQVRAKRLGFYGSRKRAGEVFELVEVKGFKQVGRSKKLEPVVLSPEQQFSSDWMEKVEGGEPAPKPEPQVSDKKPFGAKKQKTVGYSAPLDEPAAPPSTGDRKVI